jgi:hypothetical protein
MAQATRRSFLKHAAASGAVFAVGTGGRRVLGANDTIHIGVAGIHGRGNAHIGAFQKMDGVQVTHLIDPDSRLFKGRAAKLEKANGRKTTCVQDIRKALEDKDLDAVSVATCNHWHSLIALWACQAEKDAYVEKPGSHNVFEGRKVVEAMRKYKRIVQHGTQRRSGGQWKKAREIAQGKRGKLQLVRARSYRVRRGIGFRKPEEPPKELDFNIWLGPAPKQPFHRNLVHYRWHWFWDTGNGDIGNNGPHWADMGRWLIPNATLPRRVMSLGGRFLWDDQGETPNLQMAVYDYGDVKMFFEVTDLKPHLKGRPSLVFDTDAKAEPIEVTPPPDVRSPIAERGPGGNIFKNFIAAVRSRKPTDLDAHILEGHYSSSLCHLANISYRLGEDVPFNKKTKALGDDKEVAATFEWIRDVLKANDYKLDERTYRLGRTLEFDPETERFVGDDQANALLTRDYRKPFVVPQEV